MAAIVDTLMEQGALGVWTALEYAPASYSKTEEIIALAKAAGVTAVSTRRTCGTRESASTMRWMKCSASRAKRTSRPRFHT